MWWSWSIWFTRINNGLSVAATGTDIHLDGHADTHTRTCIHTKTVIRSVQQIVSGPCAMTNLSTSTTLHLTSPVCHFIYFNFHPLNPSPTPSTSTHTYIHTGIVHHFYWLTFLFRLFCRARARLFFVVILSTGILANCPHEISDWKLISPNRQYIL